MNSKFIRSLWLVLALSLVSVPGFSAGQPHHGVTQDEAVAMARHKAKDGRVLSAETRIKSGREIHSVRVLTKKGRVKNWQIDARTGEIIKRSEKRR